jgi:hypothetical protein
MYSVPRAHLLGLLPTSYVQYRLNQAVQSEKSRNLSEPVGTCRNLSEPVGTCRNLSELWKRAEIRDIFERQQWRCADFGRFLSAVMVGGNGMQPSADRTDNSQDTTCAATSASSSWPRTRRGWP